MNFWRIRWNASGEKRERSTRKFTTFLSEPGCFETYGYRKARHFGDVKKQDFVFCYQVDRKMIVGLCCVQKPEPRNSVGGPCLLLRTVCLLAKRTPKFGPPGLSKVSHRKAIAL